jgi:hypothetical protein
MKILLVGVFTYGSTDVWKKLALERLGHRVVCAPYRDRSVREHFATGEPFDVVFVSKGVPLSADDFAHLATLGRARLLWWPDPFENWDEAHTAALATGQWRLSVTSRVVAEKIATLSTTAYAWLRILEGCDCEGPRPSWRPETIEPALLHFGAMSTRRAEIVERVRAAGVRVDVLEKPLYGAQLQREVLRYAAVLGINSSPDLYSNRVQTVLAMGGTILQERAPDLEDDFRSTSLFVWHDHHDARDTFGADIARWISHLPYALRDDVAVRVFESHRWERVMERALEFACA